MKYQILADGCGAGGAGCDYDYENPATIPEVSAPQVDIPTPFIPEPEQSNTFIWWAVVILIGAATAYLLFRKRGK